MALSLSPARRMFRVIFPQGWALMIPSLATLQIQLLKGTAVASFITLQDLNDRIEVLRQATGDTMFSYSRGPPRLLRPRLAHPGQHGRAWSAAPERSDWVAVTGGRARCSFSDLSDALKRRR